MARLTDKTLAQLTAITPTTLIHIVTTGDTSQNSAGSSYKAELQQLGSVFAGLSFSGGVVNGATTFTNGLTTNTISATTYQNLPISGLTEGNNINISGSNGNYTISVTGITQGISGDYLPLSGGTVTGSTTFTNGLTTNTISATTYQNLPLGNYGTGLTFNSGTYDLSLDGGSGVLDTISLGILSSDLTITGGTYNNGTGTATFTNNTGGTFNVTGFLVGYTDTLVTGATYSNNTFTFTNSTGGTFNTLFNTVTGLTSTGTISSNILTATTYQNLPVNSLTAGNNINISGSSGNFTISVTGSSVTPYNNSGSGSTITWNVSGVSTNYEATLTATTTLNLTGVRNGDYGAIVLKQDSIGSRTLTLGTVNGSSATHRVANGGGGVVVLSTSANATDILTFTYNGSIMYWTVGNDYT
jgi:hypothetical protein